MIREIVKIDEDICNGCGECVPNCHEGALQIIDGKARLISDLMCDGLGACIGHCPLGAITIEKREAEAYDEVKVIRLMAEKGENTVVAHLKHLLDHNETGFYREAMQYLARNESSLPFSFIAVKEKLEGGNDREEHSGHNHHHHHLMMEEQGGGCPGSRSMSFGRPAPVSADSFADAPSQLSQWPVQMHLVNPRASYFQGVDVVLAADCVAYALGNFHQKYLKGRSLAIACPKLDQGQEIYVQKIRSLIEDSKINTLHLMIMQVPCCGGLSRMVQTAMQQCTRKVPVKQTVVGIQGEILSEEWI